MAFVGLLCFVPVWIAFGAAPAASITVVVVLVGYVFTRLAQQPREPRDLPERDRALSDEQFRAILTDPHLEYRQILGRLPAVVINASSLHEVADRHADVPVEPQTLEALIEDLHGEQLRGDYRIPMHEFLHFTGTRLVDLPRHHP